MKKNLLLTALVILSITSLSAQSFKFGAKAGVNFSTFVGDDADGFDSRTSFHLGAVGNFNISDEFSIQPELLYSAQGAEVSEDGENVTLKLDYITLPILADFTIAPGLSLQGGPQLGFLASEEVEANGVSVELDEFEGFDLAAALGAQYKLSETDLFFQIRYTVGITDVLQDVNVNNSTISLSVGYFFL
jgi:hypothetical protein